MIEQVIYLDMRKGPGRVPPRVTVRRGESQTQKVTARLTLDGTDYTPTYSDARLRLLHEDGTWAVCSATRSGASVSATLPSNCLNGAGRCRLAYFEFSSSNGYSETTEGFELVILENVDGNGSDEAANYDDELLQLWNKWSAFEKQAEEREGARVAAEKARASAETSRASAESSRASAEEARATAESARATAESGRASAETERAAAESARATAEASREEVEAERAAAEKARASAETSRATAEAEREKASADAVSAAEAATAGAEKVNATLAGTTLTVTDRTGASASVDVSGIDETARAAAAAAQTAADAATSSASKANTAIGALGSSITTKALTVSGSAAVGVATTGTFALPNMSAVGKWLKLGWWSNSDDSNSLIIDLYTGNGYNGCADQNAHARIMVKDGAETDISNVFGGTLQIVAGASETGAHAMKIALLASSTTNCDVYVYMPWIYTMGWMEVTCNGGKWNSDVKEQNYPTSGYTLQPVDYTGIVASWVASPGAMTIAANNASSNVTLNNTVFGNNSLNTTTGTIDNLLWDSTLLGGRVGLKLWSGTLSKGGSITVLHLNRFRVLYLTSAWAPEIKAIGINNNDSAQMSFTTGFDNGASYQMVFLFQKSSWASNTITYTCGSYHNLGDTSQAAALQVTGIWGLI